ncbi:putative membrane protein YccC [Enterococcus sp. PF1-24]|uniref:holin n=1 Tax=unclassified Enterococcus TaxID=2608891 RepID=UPI0024755EF4|nr:MULTISPECIES: holin [unclassified Enterococcus]MDH6364685.1 putative membrane protein YccC [Enterococcus sp. PFB1-1]MDH6401839.1 putative membrane protein YccC [Enterococcus sp. PF1-24]
MEQILVAIPVISTVVLSVAQLLKQVVVNHRWLPLWNVVLGILLGMLFAGTILHDELAIYAWAGGISGLAAGGFYDLGNSFVRKGE